MRLTFNFRAWGRPLTRRSRALAVGAACALMAVACGGYNGPPDIETARRDLPEAYRIVYGGEDGRTVLELLAEHVESHQTNGQGTELLITAINGITGGTEGRYWLYYVNEKAGLISSARMMTVDGDSIEWLFAR